MSAQTMKEIPIQRAFESMSENGKYMITIDQAYIGIYNTETDEYDEYTDAVTDYQVGMGNMVTNDGFLVGAVGGMPSILDIEKQEMDAAGTEGRRPAILAGQRHNALTQIYCGNGRPEKCVIRNASV